MSTVINVPVSINYQALAHDMYVWRQEHGLTQAEAGEAIGYDNAWQSLEAARHRDYYENAHCYGREMEVSMSVFLAVINLTAWNDSVETIERKIMRYISAG